MLATWTPEGTVPDMFRLIQAYKPTQPATKPACPFAWGQSHCIVELFGHAFDQGFEQAPSCCRARDGEQVWQTFAQAFGPISTLQQNLDPCRLASLRTEFQFGPLMGGCGLRRSLPLMSGLLLCRLLVGARVIRSCRL